MLLGPTAVGKRLNLSYSRVIQLANASRLPSVRDHAGRRVFNVDDVEAFAAARVTRQPVVAVAAETSVAPAA